MEPARLRQQRYPQRIGQGDVTACSKSRGHARLPYLSEPVALGDRYHGGHRLYAGVGELRLDMDRLEPRQATRLACYSGVAHP